MWPRRNGDEELRSLRRELRPDDRDSVVRWLEVRDASGFDLRAELRALLDSVNGRVVAPGEYPRWRLDADKRRHWGIPFADGDPQRGGDPVGLLGFLSELLRRKSWLNSWVRMSGRIDRPGSRDRSTFAFGVVDDSAEPVLVTVGLAKVSAGVSGPWEVWPGELTPWSWETFGGSLAGETHGILHTPAFQEMLRATQAEVYTWARNPVPDRVVAFEDDVQKLLGRASP